MTLTYERQTIVQEAFSVNLKFSSFEGFNRIGNDSNASDDSKVLIEINNNSLNEKVKFEYAHNDSGVRPYSFEIIIDKNSSIKLVLPYSYLNPGNKNLAYIISSVADDGTKPTYNSMDAEMNIKLVK